MDVKLKAVIFDMDGVIVDSEPVHYKAENIIFNELGLEVPEKMHQSFLGVSDRDMWKFLKKNFVIKMNVEDLVVRQNDIFIELLEDEKKVLTVPGVYKLIKNLENEGVTNVLASSSSLRVISKILQITGLKSMFKYVFSGQMVERSKPYPDIFRLSLDKTGFNQDESIVIEDSTNGIIAAKNAGLRVIAYQNPDYRVIDQSKADAIFTDFFDIDFNKLNNFLIN